MHSFYGFRWRHEAPRPPPRGARGPAAQSLRDAIKPFVPFKRELRGAQQQLMFARGLRRHAIDLYHEPNYVPIRFDVPVVTTVHDLSWLRYPDAHPIDRVRWLEQGFAARAGAVGGDPGRFGVRAPGGVDHVRHRAGARDGGAPGRGRAVPSAVSGSDERRSAAARLGSRQLPAHRRHDRATQEPRPRARSLCAAACLLCASAFRWWWRERRAGARARWRQGCANWPIAGQIRFLGHVPASDLPSLYAGAAAFVFPSLYEGFGLPPLEAMASGVPVLVSDRASLPEVVGEAGIRLDPDRPERTAEQIVALLDDVEQRSRMIVAGTERARGFTWTRARLRRWRPTRALSHARGARRVSEPFCRPGGPNLVVPIAESKYNVADAETRFSERVREEVTEAIVLNCPEQPLNPPLPAERRLAWPIAAKGFPRTDRAGRA